MTVYSNQITALSSSWIDTIRSGISAVVSETGHIPSGWRSRPESDTVISAKPSFRSSSAILAFGAIASTTPNLIRALYLPPSRTVNKAIRQCVKGSISFCAACFSSLSIFLRESPSSAEALGLDFSKLKEVPMEAVNPLFILADGEVFYASMWCDGPIQSDWVERAFDVIAAPTLNAVDEEIVPGEIQSNIQR